MNNRRITDEYISAAEKIGSSRLLMLAAAAYKNGGDDVKARIANKKSILLSKEESNASYSQYLLWHLFIMKCFYIHYLGLYDTITTYTTYWVFIYSSGELK